MRLAPTLSPTHHRLRRSPTKATGWFSNEDEARGLELVKSVEVVYLFFLNRGTVSSVVLGAGSGLMSVH